jgi:hypothetical protein
MIATREEWSVMEVTSSAHGHSIVSLRLRLSALLLLISVSPYPCFMVIGTGSIRKRRKRGSMRGLIGSAC